MLFISRLFQVNMGRLAMCAVIACCIVTKKQDPQVGRGYFFRQEEGTGKGNRVAHSVDILYMGRFERIALESAKLKYDFFH